MMKKISMIFLVIILLMQRNVPLVQSMAKTVKFAQFEKLMKLLKSVTVKCTISIKFTFKRQN